MENNKREFLIALYDIYGNLLTEKQKNYFEDYYFCDLSLAEIAENYEISRNGVFDQLKRVENILEDYEDKLHYYDKIKKIEALDDNCSKNEVLSIIKE